MAVRNCLDHFLAEAFSEFHDPLLVAGRAEVAALARERQKILVPTVLASNPGKSIMRITAIKISVNNPSHITPEKAILPFKALFIDLLKCLKMVFNTAIIRRIPRIPRPVDRGNFGHALLSVK